MIGLIKECWGYRYGSSFFNITGNFLGIAVGIALITVLTSDAVWAWVTV